ncbi:hypothetical protein [Staphylococcus aureus]|nr:hypothetical protein [Staphylococcus aureus]
MTGNDRQVNKPFKDITKTGKTRPWREKKVANITYAELLQILEFKKFNNVKQCGEVLEFKPRVLEQTVAPTIVKGYYMIKCKC